MLLVVQILNLDAPAWIMSRYEKWKYNLNESQKFLPQINLANGETGCNCFILQGFQWKSTCQILIDDFEHWTARTN